MLSFFNRALVLAVLAQRSLRYRNTAKIFICLTACGNNLLNELTDPNNYPNVPPLLSYCTVSFLSSVFQIAAKMRELGVYMPTVLTNLPAGAVQTQPMIQAAGLANPEPQGMEPTDRTPSAGVPQTESLAGSRPQPNTHRVPVGLEKAAQDAATAETPVQVKLQHTQGNRVQDCGHRQI